MRAIERLDRAASSRSKRRQFDVLLTVTAPHERIVFTLTIVLILLSLAWALFARIEHGITVDGVLIKPGERHEVVSVEPGHLIEFLVFPGDYVEAGDHIARQSVPQLDRELAVLRHSVELLEQRASQAENDNISSILSHMEGAHAALLEMEAQRGAREMIVAHTGGQVMELNSAPGEFVPAGTSVARIRSKPDAEAGANHAVLRTAPGIAQSINPGMQATVDVAIPNGDRQILIGEVSSVTAGPLPDWLATIKPATENSLHRIDITLHKVPEFPVQNGTSCRVRIILGEVPPISLLIPSLS